MAQTAKQNQSTQKRDFINNHALASNAIEKVKNILPGISDYEGIHYLINHENFGLPATVNEAIEQAEIDNNFNPIKNTGRRNCTALYPHKTGNAAKCC